MTEQRDRWARWLLEHRHGGDPEELARQLPNLEEFRRRVLENAEIREGDVVVDVGTGDGLIGFGALELVGEGGRVIFSDVSTDLLDECRRIAEDLGVTDRCEFLRASADDLPLPDASVDVATTRSVLIYLMDKRPAFVELHRVLRPGGRLSIFEPINIFGNETYRERYWGVDVSPVEPRPWSAFANSSGNPKIPTIAEAIEQALTPEERERFVEHLRPLVEEGNGVWRMASAYLAATKPSA